jgi:hypothetical protein
VISVSFSTNIRRIKKGVYMNDADLHLMFNHLPVIGVIVGFLVLVWGIIRRSDDVKIVGLIGLILTGVAAIAVYLTGEPAEEMVEKIPGVSGALIELHEDWAMISLVFAVITGALAMFGLVTRRMRATSLAQFAIVGTLVTSLVTGGLMARTANLGGQIRHTEIRSDVSGNPNATQPSQPEKQRDRDDDDH